MRLKHIDRRMDLQRKTIGLFVVCLLILLGLLTECRVQGRSLQRSSNQDRAKRQTLTELEDYDYDEAIDKMAAGETASVSPVTEDQSISEEENDEDGSAATTEESQSADEEEEEEEEESDEDASATATTEETQPDSGEGSEDKSAVSPATENVNKTVENNSEFESESDNETTEQSSDEEDQEERSEGYYWDIQWSNIAANK